MLNVQFADSTDAVIVSYFGCPQSETAYINQGTLATSDARWAAFYNALPPSTQQTLPAPT
jgi:hypothetical protein